ncbi:hypothetical protein [Peribacillus tepidiphilus]|uniref:hypothetical protein n=1 Tax=Peribacillus tepidiphilus TaxID=2652445 RepID=UPI001290F901|nr:hypothetical protein [Peribacillus tepidiphilus]
MEKSFIFDSVNGDRKYKAEDWTNYFSKFITNGVFPNIASNLQVIADGTDMTVRLKAGAAWINGRMYENTDDLILPIDVADGVLNRIDRIVIQLSYVNREIRAKVKKGTFASSPVAPTLQRDADVYELGIADISVNKGITSIKQSLVTDLRLNTSLCGIVSSLIQPDTTAIFNQYQQWFNETSQMHEDEFQTWFDSIKGQLEGDIAANLANQITQLDQEVATLEQAQASHLADYVQHPAYGVASGSANSYSVTLNPAPTSYVEGMAVSVKINVDNTGSSTININNLGAKSIKKPNGNDVSAGNLKTGSIYTLRYNGTNFILQGEGASGNAVASDLLSGKTATTDAGDIVGTMPNRGMFNLPLGASVPAGYYSGGTVPNGKKFASGTATSNSTTSTFQHTTGANFNSLVPLIVSGLTFKPSIIVMYKFGGGLVEYIVYNAANDGISAESVKVLGSINSSYTTIEVYNMKANAGAAYVNSSGFCLPVKATSSTYNWIAYE